MWRQYEGLHGVSINRNHVLLLLHIYYCISIVKWMDTTQLQIMEVEVAAWIVDILL